MNKIEGLIWLLIGLGFGLCMPIGIEQTIQYFSPREVFDPNRAFLIYYLIAFVLGIVAGRTMFWVHQNKHDNRISGVLGFLFGFIGICAYGMLNSSSETYYMATLVAISTAIFSGIVNAFQASDKIKT